MNGLNSFGCDGRKRITTSARPLRIDWFEYILDLILCSRRSIMLRLCCILDCCKIATEISCYWHNDLLQCVLFLPFGTIYVPCSMYSIVKYCKTCQIANSSSNLMLDTYFDSVLILNTSSFIFEKSIPVSLLFIR